MFLLLHLLTLEVQFALFLERHGMAWHGTEQRVFIKKCVVKYRSVVQLQKKHRCHCKIRRETTRGSVMSLASFDFFETPPPQVSRFDHFFTTATSVRLSSTESVSSHPPPHTKNSCIRLILAEVA
jgi:hypothetical protein